jgi:hypothetical protein
LVVLEYFDLFVAGEQPTLAWVLLAGFNFEVLQFHSSFSASGYCMYRAVMIARVRFVNGYSSSGCF